MAVTEQQAPALPRAELVAALADLQVILMRRLAAQLRTTATRPSRSLPVEAAADQLEASLRQLRCALRQGPTPRG